MIAANVSSFIALPIWFVIFYETYFYLPVGQITHSNVMALILMVALIIPFHEFLHYLTVLVISPKTRVTYGLKPPFNPYVAMHGRELTSGKRITFLLVPFIIITLGFGALSMMFPHYAYMWIIVAATNASGSITDLARVAQIVRKGA